MTGGRLEGVGVVKRFGGLTAVDEVTVRTEPARITALIGPNGAGKTTLFQCLTGGERPEAGRVLLDGRDNTGLSPDARARAGVGRTFQRLAVFPTMAVADNLHVAAEHRTTASTPVRTLLLLAGILGFPVGDEKRDRRRVAEIVELLDLAAVADAPAGTLPTGTLRMVELGRALCHDPRVLLLDEPASGLDTVETERLQRVLRDVAAGGVSILLVEHDVDLVFGVADHVYAMAEGRVVAAGSPADVRRDPAVLDAYLDPMANG